MPGVLIVEAFGGKGDNDDAKEDKKTDPSSEK